MSPLHRLSFVLATGASLVALAASDDGSSGTAAEEVARCLVNGGGACKADVSDRSWEEATDSTSFIQRRITFSKEQQRLEEDRSKATLERIQIVNGELQRGGKKVKPLGGNWAIKARPYFAPLDIVRKNAKAMADGVKSAAYKPSDGSEVVPMVRLGVFWEAAMPDKGTPEVDEGFAKQLDDTIKAFASEGVYVFLDNHQDALSTTNGGEGFPWWVAAQMQSSDPEKDYIVSPEHPLSLAIPKWFQDIISEAGITFPSTQIALNSTDPWRPYSVGTGEDPKLMNIGNPSIRENNADATWVKHLEFSYQVQNVGRRFLTSHSSKMDRVRFFEPFVSYMLHLTNLWESNPNVIAVGLMNEPPITGVQDIVGVMQSGDLLWDFYSAVVKELIALKGSENMLTPISVEQIDGGVFGGSPLLSMVATQSLNSDTLETFRSLASRNQLMFDYHYYPGLVTKADFQTMVGLAREEADYIGGAQQRVPIYLSEYWNHTAQEMANTLVVGSELGCDAVTYWQYADLEWTGNDGWYKYPESVEKLGGPLNSDGTINKAAWEEYVKTVNDGTSWGAEITGGSGAQMGVLEKMPEASSVKVDKSATEGMVRHNRYGGY